MSYVVSARRWRPQTFEDLIGQEHVTRTLQNAIGANRVAHAFLFTGVRGVGKTTAARILAKALNCEKGPTATPCNECTNCREITASTAVDVLEIDGASNTGVDDVREIIENVRYQAAKSRFKIYIIDEVHMLSNSAFNALLKTLEEPPPHVKFIFATTDPHKLPATVQSRCQRYDFRRIPLRMIVDRLRQIVSSEQVEIGDRALYILAREGEGSMRDAQSLLDQVLAYGSQSISDEDVLATLGVADRAVVYDIAEALIERNAERVLRRVNETHQHGYDMRRLGRDLLEHMRDLAVANVTGGSLLPDLPVEEQELVKRQAERIGGEDCDRAFRILTETEEEMGRAFDPKLVLEMALIRVATLPPAVPLVEILERLESMEGRLRRAGGTGGQAPARASQPTTPSAAPSRSQTAELQNAVQANAGSGGVGSSNTHTWEDFVAFVATKRTTLAHHLGRCEPARFDDSSIEILAPWGFYYDYLARQDHVAEIEDLAREFFGRASGVRIQQAAATARVDEDESKKARANQSDLRETAMGNPAVRAAMEILGGEVRTVRSRATRPREAK
jgi:DNA polymerase-3 subunit gamma/tau